MANLYSRHDLLFIKDIHFGRFIKMFYKMTTCPRQPLLSGPKSGRLHRFGCIHFVLKIICFIEGTLKFVSDATIFVSQKDFQFTGAGLSVSR